MSSQSVLIPPQPAPNWKITADEIITIALNVIDKSRSIDDSIASVKNPNFGNVILPFIENENIEKGQINQLSFYQHISNNKDIRDASSKADEMFQSFGIEQGLREDVYLQFKSIYENLNNLKNIDDEDKRLIKKINIQYKRNGLDLKLEDREKIKNLRKQLSLLTVKFSKNLGEENGFLEFTKDELDGVPKDIIEQFETFTIIDDKTGKETKKYKMNFKYPSLFPVLTHAKLQETRKKAFIADQNKVPENENLLLEAIKIRASIAHLLGYETHSDFILEERMAKNYDSVYKFLKDLETKLKPQGIKERFKMLELKKQDLKNQGKEITKDDEIYYVWDHRYYHNMLLENDYQLDDQKISEYFPMSSTIKKMLGIFEKLFNLKFLEVLDDEKSVWHKDVQQFAVWKQLESSEKEKVEFVGWLYFDLHPREGKYNHAANFGIIPGYTSSNGTRVYPVTALVCNFSKPTATKPSLLKHNEVTTFFHELGHGIHDLIGKSKYSRFSGTEVSWDFVEAPSQMLEYWTWSINQLKYLSSHYLNPEESLPDDLIKRLIKSKHVNGSLFNLRQLHFALFDLKLHSLKENEDIKLDDIINFWNLMREEISLVSQSDFKTKGFASFGHLMGGYDSGYYGYLWSQVFAADIYYTKFKNDPMNNKNGIEYRDKVLARGGTRDEIENLRDLLGREPNNKAFLEEIGIN